MRIGDKIDLNRNKESVNRFIARYGVSRSYNELAMSIHCKDEVGYTFCLVQFWNNRSVLHVMSV